MASRIFFFLLVVLVFLPFSSLSLADTPLWVKAGYYYSGSETSASDIKSTLFTHLLCAFAFINSTSYKIFINSSEEHKFSTFTNTVKLQNPSVTTLLSIYGGTENSSVFNSMLNQSSYRKSFIDSSIRTATKYGFQGIDLSGVWPRQGKDLANLGTLLKDWRDAITSEARNSSKPELVLVMAGYYLKASDSSSYPFESMQKNLDWVHFVAYDYYLPQKDSVTGFHAALYGPSGWESTDSGIKEWRRRGFSSTNLVIGLPYHGYAWTLVNPGDSSVGAPASGPAITMDGSMGYKLLKSYIRSFGNVVSHYNDTFVVNHFTVADTTWVNFDDVEVIKEKVSYAKKNGLLGYNVFQVGNDDNWVLSRAAQEVHEDHHKRKLLIIAMLTTLTATLLLGILFCYYYRRVLAATLATITTRVLYKLRTYSSTAEKDLDGNSSDLIVFSYLTIKVATDNFSKENKLGEGGFGAVYKVTFGNSSVSKMLHAKRNCESKISTI